MRRPILLILISICFLGSHNIYSQESALKLIATIPMPHVTGRIDHLAIDIKRRIIFVAALGNNTIEVVDIKSKKVIHTIKGLHKPQGIKFIPESNTVIVANGDTGECDIFNAETFQKMYSVKLSGDADNVRLDPSDKKIYVGYADGAIAIIDAVSFKLLSEIKLTGHPESFQLDKASKRIFVNVPDSKQIEIINLESNSVKGSWKMTEEKNYPMALDESNHRVFVGFRQPAKILIIDTETGKTVSSLGISDDVDDVFYNSVSKQIYLSCGRGYIDIIKQENPDTYKAEEKVASRSGARTCLFVPELKLLAVAAPSGDNIDAALLVYQIK